MLEDGVSGLVPKFCSQGAVMDQFSHRSSQLIGLKKSTSNPL